MVSLKTTKPSTITSITMKKKFIGLLSIVGYYLILLLSINYDYNKVNAIIPPISSSSYNTKILPIKNHPLSNLRGKSKSGTINNQMITPIYHPISKRFSDRTTTIPFSGNGKMSSNDNDNNMNMNMNMNNNGDSLKMTQEEEQRNINNNNNNNDNNNPLKDFFTTDEDVKTTQTTIPMSSSSNTMMNEISDETALRKEYEQFEQWEREYYSNHDAEMWEEKKTLETTKEDMTEVKQLMDYFGINELGRKTGRNHQNNQNQNQKQHDDMIQKMNGQKKNTADNTDKDTDKDTKNTIPIMKQDYEIDGYYLDSTLYDTRVDTLLNLLDGILGLFDNAEERTQFYQDHDPFTNHARAPYVIRQAMNIDHILFPNQGIRYAGNKMNDKEEEEEEEEMMNNVDKNKKKQKNNYWIGGLSGSTYVYEQICSSFQKEHNYYVPTSDFKDPETKKYHNFECIRSIVKYSMSDGNDKKVMVEKFHAPQGFSPFDEKSYKYFFNDVQIPGIAPMMKELERRSSFPLKQEIEKVTDYRNGKDNIDFWISQSHVQYDNKHILAKDLEKEPMLVEWNVIETISKKYDNRNLEYEDKDDEISDISMEIRYEKVLKFLDDDFNDAITSEDAVLREFFSTVLKRKKDPENFSKLPLEKASMNSKWNPLPGSYGFPGERVVTDDDIFYERPSNTVLPF